MAEGYKRAEVLVPASLRPRVEKIAAQEGAGLTDTLSALLQYGLDHYETQHAQAHPAVAASASALLTSERLNAAVATASTTQAGLQAGEVSTPPWLAGPSVVPVTLPGAPTPNGVGATQARGLSQPKLASFTPDSVGGAATPVTPQQASVLSTYLRSRKDSPR